MWKRSDSFYNKDTLQNRNCGDTLMFNFLKNLGSPESGEKAIRKVYDAALDPAEEDWRKRNFAALQEAMTLRYKLRRKFISDATHLVEVAPFALMDESKPGSGIRNLVQYLLLQEIPGKMNPGLLDIMKSRIESSILDAEFPSTNTTHTVYIVMVSLFPYVEPSDIFWSKFIDPFVFSKLIDDAMRFNDPEAEGEFPA